jgi:hypothetical protein
VSQEYDDTAEAVTCDLEAAVELVELEEEEER